MAENWINIKFNGPEIVGNSMLPFKNTVRHLNEA